MSTPKVDLGIATPAYNPLEHQAHNKSINPTDLTTQALSQGKINSPQNDETNAKPITPKRADSLTTPLEQAVNNVSLPQFKKDSIESQKKSVKDIKSLVSLGKTSGTKEHSKDEIASYLEEKIKFLEMQAKNKNELTSIRKDLLDLSDIAIAHYGVQKEKILDLLIQILENDPVLKSTAADLVHLILKLNGNLELPEAQGYPISFQIKHCKAFSTAVELYLKHYEKKEHVNALTKELKSKLIDTQNKLESLNKQNNGALSFYQYMALEASKRLTSNADDLKEFLERCGKVGTALKKLYDKDLTGFATGMGEALKDIGDKIKAKWFDDLFLMRKLLSEVEDDSKKLKLVEHWLLERRSNYCWQSLYGVFEIIEQFLKTSSNTLLKGTILLKFSLNNFFQSEPLNDEKKIICDKRAKQLWQNFFPAYFQSLSLDNKMIVVTYGMTKWSSDDFTEILKHNKDWLNTKNNQSDTPLTLAANSYNCKDSVKIFHLLMAAGADHRIPGSGGRTVLHHLVKWEPEPFKDCILKYPFLMELINIHTTDFRITPLMAANHKGKTHLDIYKILVSKAHPHKNEKGQNVLHEAVQSDSKKLVSFVVKTYPHLINEPDNEGHTPLHLCCFSFIHEEHWKTLITHGANILTKSNKSETIFDAAVKLNWKLTEYLVMNHLESFEPKINQIVKILHLALQKNNSKLIDKLVAKRDWLNRVDEGYTALMLAAKAMYINVFKFLIKLGADIEISNNGCNVLDIALQARNPEFVKILCNHKSISKIINRSYNPPLAYARNLDEFKMLVKAGADVNFIGMAKISNQQFQGNLLDLRICYEYCYSVNSLTQIEIIQYLVSQYPSLLKPNEKNSKDTPLLWLAACFGLSEVVEVLMPKLDPTNLDVLDSEGQTILHASCYRGDKKFIKSILAKYPHHLNKQDTNGYTPVMIAAKRGNRDACEILIQEGADVSLTDKNGLNTLHIAILGTGKLKKPEYNKWFDFLTKKLKLHLDHKDSKGLTPLFYAANFDCLDYIKTLVNHGAKIDAIQDSSGMNILHVLVSYRSTAATIDYLVTTCPSLIDMQDVNHETPLDIAIRKKNDASFEALIKGIAARKNTEGKSIFHYAALYGSVKIMKDLVKNYSSNLESLSSKDKELLLLLKDESSEELCQILMSEVAKIDRNDPNGWNILHHAALKGSEPLVASIANHYQHLLESRDGKGLTPLLLAKAANRSTICLTLIKAGAIPETENNDQPPEVPAQPVNPPDLSSNNLENSELESAKKLSSIESITTAAVPADVPLTPTNNVNEVIDQVIKKLIEIENRKGSQFRSDVASQLFKAAAEHLNIFNKVKKLTEKQISYDDFVKLDPRLGQNLDYALLMDKILKRCFPKGPDDLVFISQEMRSQAWDQVRDKAQQLLSPLMEKLANPIQIMKILFTSLETGRNLLREELKKTPAQVTLHLSETEEACGLMITAMLEMMTLPKWVLNRLKDPKTGEILDKVKIYLTHLIVSSLDQKFIKNHFQDIKENIPLLNTEKNALLDNLTDRSKSDSEVIQKIQVVRLNKLFIDCIDALVKIEIKNYANHKFSSLDLKIERIFGKNRIVKTAIKVVFLTLTFFFWIVPALFLLMTYYLPTIKYIMARWIHLNKNTEILLEIIKKTPEDQPRLTKHSRLNERLIYRFIEGFL